jgi:7-carboxy-7-deazaguanine synthase
MGGGNVRINDIYLTLQGEGALTGTPMLLVRTHGCSVGCPWCDTKETWVNQGTVDTVGELLDLPRPNPTSWEASPQRVAQAVLGLMPDAITWVLLTGGEPGEQEADELREFVGHLHEAGKRIAVETSGTALGPWDVVDHVCVSPKINMPGGRVVLASVVAQAHELKCVIGREQDVQVLDEFLVGNPTPGQVFLQPLSCSPKATALCIQTCMERGWRLSLQTHKTVGLP